MRVKQCVYSIVSVQRCVCTSLCLYSIVSVQRCVCTTLCFYYTLYNTVSTTMSVEHCTAPCLYNTVPVQHLHSGHFSEVTQLDCCRYARSEHEEVAVRSCQGQTVDTRHSACRSLNCFLLSVAMPRAAFRTH